MLRLLRAAKVNEAVMVLQERTSSEFVVIVTDMGKMLLTLLWVSHIGACFWYGIGSNMDENSWMVHWERVHSHLSKFHWYVVSFQWALTQFMGGMDEVRPVSEFERLFTVLALTIGFVMGVFFV